jgi:tRNA threonylcarbamoyladenosine biosynthesis protein TsaB
VKILALDTATEGCSAALSIDGHIIHREAEFERGHAVRILPMIDDLLTTAAVSLSQLDAIAFGRGPGSFTGIRLAASVTQGLAFGADLPVVPISDLRAVAQQTMRGGDVPVRTLVCNDARMQEVYWGCFESGPDGLMNLIGEERVTKPAVVTLPDEWITPVHAVGRGFAAYPELRGRLGERLINVDDRALPHAKEIAILAAPEIRAGRTVSAEEAVPVYLRDDVARPKSFN